jgi:hypothetical protein
MTIKTSGRNMLVDAAKLALGALRFVKTGSTPDSAYQSMIRLFCTTSGRSNDALSKLISILHPAYKLPEANGLLGRLHSEELSCIASALNEKGFYVFRQQLPEALCDSLLRFALTNRCIRRGSDGTPSVEVDRFPRANAQAVRYDFPQQDVIDNADVQKLMADPSIVAVAQNYLRCKPIVDVTTMWWHTAYSKVPDKDAAQFWHFDMDRIKWLKFFIYVTDVEKTNGPHSFVEGSHRTGGIPSSLLSKGYSRLDDAEVNVNYSSRQIIEFAAPRGTVIAEDTRGLHKGRHVEHGDRLMLQLQFSNSLFGGNYPPVRITDVVDPQLAAMQAKYPRIYSSYLK